MWKYQPFFSVWHPNLVFNMIYSTTLGMSNEITALENLLVNKLALFGSNMFCLTIKVFMQEHMGIWPSKIGPLPGNGDTQPIYIWVSSFMTLYTLPQHVSNFHPCLSSLITFRSKVHTHFGQLCLRHVSNALCQTMEHGPFNNLYNY